MSKAKTPNPDLSEAEKDVLNRLEESQMILTPSVLALNSWYTRQTATRALKKLVRYGMAEKVSRGHYRVHP